MEITYNHYLGEVLDRSQIISIGGGYKSGEIWGNLKKSLAICASENFRSRN